MNANDNAFPTTGNGPTDGLTKREWFAGMVLAGLSANSDLASAATNQGLSAKDAQVAYAISAVHQADALIAALNEGEKKCS